MSNIVITVATKCCNENYEKNTVRKGDHKNGIRKSECRVVLRIYQTLSRLRRPHQRSFCRTAWRKLVQRRVHQGKNSAHLGALRSVSKQCVFPPPERVLCPCNNTGKGLFFSNFDYYKSVMVTNYKKTCYCNFGPKLAQISTTFYVPHSEILGVIWQTVVWLYKLK